MIASKNDNNNSGTKEIIIWPTYIDAKKSRKEGRKVPKELGVNNPRLKDIESKLRKMGYEFKTEKDKSYPRENWKICGYIKVKVNDENISKLEFLKRLCKSLKA
ncbi:MAG: signal recognition particle subunit [Methanothermococcus sp.]|jgi:signal recognition particle subunit SRP19|uniref:signal recognition particle subunit SRP19/SEC65 family protein n=1 Tax=Methanothermococcus TaxID=155862 RepID=UPI00037FD790|nr:MULTISPECIES: signal recognition particle subunit SRP19/SEC65 family protein [Methanothermococcus]MDK2789627.1 signal recognition particle subunit [Methanothermococcus sp.]MDK2988069.1 signal recognition particle subunit [Methanothermococcus sp.]